MAKYIFGNFKMNMDIKESTKYVEELLPLVKNSKNKIAIFPSFVNLMFVNQKLTASNVQLGAQDVSYDACGSHTGDVSAKMLKSVGTKYVIVGHSERRKSYYEKNETINKKIKQSLSEGLQVVLCIGETKYERQTKKVQQVIETDLLEALKGLYANELKNIIIAYEPLWAIGTGKLPLVKEVEKVIEIIKNKIKTEYSASAVKDVKILYGGSINSINVKNYINIKGIDGVLIGGASLNPVEFAKIANL